MEIKIITSRKDLASLKVGDVVNRVGGKGKARYQGKIEGKLSFLERSYYNYKEKISIIETELNEDEIHISPLDKTLYFHGNPGITFTAKHSGESYISRDKFLTEVEL